ncbi:MAG: hypothetical protein P4L53_23775 [Candidatus Obscuribacterales bacterium]|nr:hypothetical protein [Candidatus Obscuribacterales bacterium]
MSYGISSMFGAAFAHNTLREPALNFEAHAPAHQETSIRIARGATRQMLFIGSGERLNSAIHAREVTCSLEFTHQADGKVSVICRDTPFIYSIAFESAGDRYNSFRSYTTYNSLTANKRQNLLATQRTGGVWVLQFVGRNYRLDICPGETLVVTHKAG